MGRIASVFWRGAFAVRRLRSQVRTGRLRMGRPGVFCFPDGAIVSWRHEWGCTRPLFLDR